MTPYREYLAWLARQDTGAAADAWARALAGLEEPTLLAPGADRAQVPVRPDNLVTELPGGLAAALERHARGQAVTVNTVMQAAWAMLAGALTGRDDVVFGAVVAGAAGGAARGGDHAGAVHQHRPGPGPAGPRGHRRAVVGPAAGPAVGAAGLPLPGPGADPAGSRAGRGLRHPGRLRELPPRPRRPGPARSPARTGYGSPAPAGTTPRITR